MNSQTQLDEKINLKSLNKAELQEFTEDLGLQSFRSDQLFQWLYQKGVHTFDEMTNLSKDLREQLKKVATVPTIKHVRQQESRNNQIFV